MSADTFYSRLIGFKSKDDKETLTEDEFRDFIKKNPQKILWWKSECKDPIQRDCYDETPICWEYSDRDLGFSTRDFTHILTRYDEYCFVQNDVKGDFISLDEDFDQSSFSNSAMRVIFIRKDVKRLGFGIGNPQTEVLVPGGKKIAGWGEVDVKISNPQNFLRELYLNAKIDTDVKLQKELNHMIADILRLMIQNIIQANSDPENIAQTWNNVFTFRNSLQQFKVAQIWLNNLNKQGLTLNLNKVNFKMIARKLI